VGVSSGLRSLGVVLGQCAPVLPLAQADNEKRRAPRDGRGKPRAVPHGRRAAPVISLPTSTLGDANGEPCADANKFSGEYTHRTITGGIGHNLPQEAPQPFADAMVDDLRQASERVRRLGL